MRRRSITGLTLPGTCRSVKSGASGNSSQKTSRQRSPPRMPVSQSWTRATRGRPPAPCRRRARSARACRNARSPRLDGRRGGEGNADRRIAAYSTTLPAPLCRPPPARPACRGRRTRCARACGSRRPGARAGRRRPGPPPDRAANASAVPATSPSEATPSTSRCAGMSLATTGRPSAIASTTASGIPSLREGAAKTSKAGSRRAASGTSPANLTRPADAEARRRARRRRGSSGPAPISASVYGRRVAAAARSSTSSRLTSSKRAAHADHGRRAGEAERGARVLERSSAPRDRVARRRRR